MGQQMKSNRIGSRDASLVAPSASQPSPKSAYGSMSLNNNNPVNNESQGSGNGSGNWAEHKGRYKGLGLPGANHEHSDQVKDRKGDG